MQNLPAGRGGPILGITRPKKDGIAPATQGWDEGVTPQPFPRPLDATSSLQERIVELLPQGPEIVTILDMRPGPWTFKDCLYPDKRARVVAFDPLASGCDGLEAMPCLHAPLGARTLWGKERDARFASDEFDLVFARDWVDRSFDGVQAVLEMVRIVKSGCYVLLEHHSNEAGAGADPGLRPWNFSMNDAGDFLICSQAGAINMTQKYREVCSIECAMIHENERWLITRIRKHSSP